MGIRNWLYYLGLAEVESGLGVSADKAAEYVVNPETGRTVKVIKTGHHGELRSHEEIERELEKALKDFTG